MKSIEDVSAIWEMMLNTIREDRELPTTVIELWFDKCRLDSLSVESAVFSCPTDLTKNTLKKRYTDFLGDHLKRIIGFVPKSLEFVTDPSLADEFIPGESPTRKRMQEIIELRQEARRAGLLESEEEEIRRIRGTSPYISRPSASGGITAEKEEEEEKKLVTNLDYTFDTFVVGRTNAMAHANALSVAENPGRLINPLFIYGPSGLGKTHLMYAVANRVLERDHTMNVIYVKGEDFMNQLITAIKTGKTGEFRNKFRGADMLLIDDIQYIASSDSTQTEFFHTFDALYENHKQIIITSDRPPQELTILDERIRSRFEQGLLADIHPPDLELRLAILKTKAEYLNLEIPPEVLFFLAERLHSNVRTIEGIVKKLAATNLLTGMPVTLDMVKTTVPEFIRDTGSVNDYVDSIVECVARRCHVEAEEIFGKKRTKEIRNARNIAIYVIRKLTPLSLPKIGSLFERDYSTIHSNLSTVEKQMTIDPLFESEIQDIIREMKRN